MKAALGTLARRVGGTGARVITAVHDEIILEADENGAEAAALMLKEAMESSGNAVLKDVPCAADASIADTWAGKS
jgi:DNA polymerase I-like protein with 3'-5' exonuclease and polymerase domains